MSQPDNELIAYSSGVWLPTKEVTLSLDDVGAKQGVIAVERMRTYDGQIFLADRHLHRFDDTVSALEIAGLPSSRELSSLLDELLQRNSATVTSAPMSIVVMATPGVGGNPTLIMRLESIDVDRVQQFVSDGQPLVITQVVQPPMESWSRQLKVRSRLHYYLADRAAQKVDPRASGILLDAADDEEKLITETSIANLAIVENGKVVSPPRNTVLRGVTQSLIEELAEELGIAWREEQISADRLLAAEEVLQMGTTAGLWYASKIDREPIADTPALKPLGPIFGKLRKRFDSFIADQ